MSESASPTKIVFLYTEIAGYFLACARKLSESAEVMIVRWPVNKEAPFQFELPATLNVVDKEKYSETELRSLVQQFNPDVLVCSGWMDKSYLKIARGFGKRIPVVVSLDNHWTGSLKQRIASLISPFYLRRIFTHAWVPGKPQAEFAKHLGFGENILLNFYCADTGLFQGIYERTFSKKCERFPRRFLYVARYVEHKGIFELWEAFRQVRQELKSDWELWCIGTGDQWDQRVESEGIRHVGFVQPADLESYIAETGIYILPSKFEPWGVTVQEFAVCGFPMIVSDAVGSATRFLDANGASFKAGDVNELKDRMRNMMTLSDAELAVMGQKSHELGMSLTPEIWAQNLLKLVKK